MQHLRAKVWLVWLQQKRLRAALCSAAAGLWGPCTALGRAELQCLPGVFVHADRAAHVHVQRADEAQLRGRGVEQGV